MDNPSPQQPPINLHTTTQILKQTTTTFSTHLLPSLLLSSLLLFSLHSNLHSASHSLTSFIDHDPSLKSLLSHLYPTPHPHQDLDHTFFNNKPTPQPNSSFLLFNSFDPKLGFSNLVSDNGIRVSEIMQSSSKISFKVANFINTEEVLEQNKDLGIDNLHLFLKRFDLDHHQMTALLFLISVLSASYGFAVFLFVVSYSWVLGIVFVLVVDDLVKGFKSVFRRVWDGSNMGLKRLSGYIVMRWAVRDAMTQLLGVWWFGEVEDQYVFFRIFVRLKLMPFSVGSPWVKGFKSWVKGFEREIYGFLVSWFLLDTLISFVFAVDAWVVMVDTRKSVKEVVKEGCHLLLLMLHPAINLKCLECIVCGSLRDGRCRIYLGSCLLPLFSRLWRFILWSRGFCTTFLLNQKMLV